MTCDPRLISHYRDGALSFEERFWLEAHLRECDECSATLRGLMRLAQVVRSLPMEPVSPTLRHDVRRLIAEREATRRRPMALGGLGRALAPAAIAASIAVSALVAFRPGGLELGAVVGRAPAVSSVPAAAPPSASGQAPIASSSNVGPAGQLTGVASSARPEAAPAAQVAKPPMHVPVSENGAGGLPARFVNPAQVPEPIARLHGSNAQVRELLGAPFPGSKTVTLLEQSFQGGLAIWRSDTRQIYVLHRDGNTWTVHSDTWKPGERVTVDAVPPPGAMVPTGGFGTVWRTSPEVKSRLGWAVYEPRGSGGSIQAFERGLIVWTPHGLLYVLSNDGRWRTFPDASPL